MALALKNMLALSTVMSVLFNCGLPACQAQDVSAGQKISDVSARIVLKSIELNRFILHYRLEADRQPKFRVWRYFATQECEPAGLLAYDIITTKQFGANTRTPLEVSQGALRAGLNASLVGTTIAGSGSLVELGSNLLRAIRNRKHGFDAKSAAAYVKRTLAELDQLRAERTAIVSTLADPTAREMLTLEGQVLEQLRNYYIHEFLVFHTDTSGYRDFENCFFALDVSNNAIGMTSAIYGLKGLKRPQYIGTSNILFATAGAITMVAPLAATAYSKLARRHARKSMMRAIAESDPTVDYEALQENLRKLDALVVSANINSVESSGPILRRLALYARAGSNFEGTLGKERRQLGNLSKVAVESNLLGPLIGATAMVQGILGTAAYYGYQRNATTLSALRTADKMNLAGSIIGLTGASTATVGTAGAFGAYELYRHKLSKANRLPSQLINQRLALLDQVERDVRAVAK